MNMTTFTTLTGVEIDLADPRWHKVNLADIAGSLAKINRWNGHTRQPISVAAHSIFVSWILREWGYPSAIQRCGLLHDATEAYMGDIPTPMKWIFPQLRAYEMELWGVVREALGNGDLPREIPEPVKTADMLSMIIEWRHPMGRNRIGAPYGYEDALDTPLIKLAHKRHPDLEYTEKLTRLIKKPWTEIVTDFLHIERKLRL